MKLIEFSAQNGNMMYYIILFQIFLNYLGKLNFPTQS